MNNKAITVKKDSLVIADEVGEAYDLGAYTKLHVHLRVKLGSNASQNIQLQHSAVDEDGAYKALGSSLTLVTVGNYSQDVSNFLRYVRYTASNGITSNPTVSLFIIAKEN